MIDEAARFSEDWFKEQAGLHRPVPPQGNGVDFNPPVEPAVGAPPHEAEGDPNGALLGLGERVAALLEQEDRASAAGTPRVLASYQDFAAAQQEVATLRSHAASLVMDKIEAAEAEGARIRAAARQDAEEIRGRVHQEASALRAEAEAEVAGLRARASERLTALMSQAEAEVREFLDRTSREAQQVQEQTWVGVRGLLVDTRALADRLEGFLGERGQRPST